MDNVINMPENKNVYYRYILRLHWLESEPTDVTCTYFGRSLDDPAFILFANNHPDDDSETAEIPEFMVNSATLRYIQLMDVEEVEK